MDDIKSFATPGTFDYFGPEVQVESITVTVYWSNVASPRTPYSILSSEILGSANPLSVVRNISRFRVLSQEAISSIIKTNRNTKQRPLISTELISRAKLQTTNNLRSFGQISIENFINPKINFNFKNISVISTEFISKPNISYNFRISKVHSLNSQENFVNPRINTISRAINYNLISLEVISRPLLSTRTRYNIFGLNLNEIFSNSKINLNFKVFQNLSLETFASTINFLKISRITNYQSSTQEIIGNSNLKARTFINPYSVRSQEFISSNFLVYISRFRLFSIRSQEIVQQPYLYNRFYERFNTDNPFTIRHTESSAATFLISTISVDPLGRSLQRNDANNTVVTRAYSYYNLFSANPNQYLNEDISPIGKENWLSYSGYLRMNSFNRYSGLGFALGENFYLPAGSTLNRNDIRFGYYVIIDSQKASTTIGTNPNRRIGEFRIVKCQRNTTTDSFVYNTVAFANFNNLIGSQITAANTAIKSETWYKVLIYTRSVIEGNIPKVVIHAWLFEHPSGTPISYLTFTDTSNVYTQGRVGIISLAGNCFFDQITIIPPKTIGGSLAIDGSNVPGNLLRNLNLTIRSQEIFPQAVLRNGSSFVNFSNRSISSTETIPRAKLNINTKIYGIESEQVHPLQRLNPLAPFIKPYSLKSLELFINPFMNTGGLIFSKSIVSLEDISKSTLRPSNINIIAYSLLSNERNPKQNIKLLISSNSILTNELINNFKLNTFAKINIHQINSLEIFSGPKLNANSILRPSSAITIESHTNSKINVFGYVKPTALITNELISLYNTNIYIKDININSSEIFNNVSLKLEPYILNIRPIISSEIFNDFNKKTISTINIISIFEIEKLINSTLLPGNINTNPKSIISSEIVNNLSINSQSVMNLYGMSTNENVTKSKLESRSFVYPYNLQSQEFITLNSLEPKSVNIRHISISSIENLGDNLLKLPNTIYEVTISSEEVISINKLLPSSVNISAFSIDSNELNNFIRAIKLQYIYLESLISEQNINNSKINSTIYSYSIYNDEIISDFVLKKEAYKLNPFTIISSSIINIFTILKSNSIKPFVLASSEFISQNQVKPAIWNIEHYSILSDEVNDLININSLNTVLVKAITSSEQFTSNKFNASKEVNLFSIISNELISVIKSSGKIFPFAITSAENISSSIIRHRLYPYSLSAEETLLSEGLYFYNRWYDNFETLQWRQVRNYSSPPNAGFGLSDNNSLSGGKSLYRNNITGDTQLYYGYLDTKESLLSIYGEDRYYYSGWIRIESYINPFGSAGLGILLDQAPQFGTINGVQLGYYALIDINPNSNLSHATFRIIKTAWVNGNVEFVLANNNDYTQTNSSGIGYINTKTWYRIILEVLPVSSNNQEGTRITAKLYEGSSGTPKHTLTFDDYGQTRTITVNNNPLNVVIPPYTKGLYGVSGFHDTYYDNLTNIPPQFWYIHSLRSQEIFATPIIKSDTYIRLNNFGIKTIEQIVNPRISNIVSPSSFDTSEILNKTDTLLGAAIIRIPQINSSEIVPVLNVRIPNVIYDITIASTEIIDNHILNPSVVNILPNSLSSEELNINLIIDSINYIYPYSQIEKEIISSDFDIFAGGIISPLSIQSLEFIANFQLKSEYFVYSNSITSSELFGNGLKINLIINPLEISTAENLVNPSLVSLALIAPYQIDSLEIQNLQKIQLIPYILNPYSINEFEKFGESTLSLLGAITPFSIISEESVFTLVEGGQISLLFRPFSILSIETFGNFKNNIYINPYQNDTLEFVSSQNPTINNIIRPINILTDEILNNPLLFTEQFIIPVDLQTQEFISKHVINSIANIYPIILDSQETISNANVNAKVFEILPYSILSQEEINSNFINIRKNIAPYSILSEEVVLIQSINPGLANIYPYSISSDESILTSDVKPLAGKIYPFTIDQSESIANSNLITFAFITPSSITTSELFTNRTVMEQFYKFIEPKGIKTQEAVPVEYPRYSLTKLDPIKFSTSTPVVNPPVEYDSNNWVYLTEDGENLFAWPTDEEYYYIIRKNNIQIEIGWILSKEDSVLLLSDEFQNTDFIEVLLYDNYYYDGVHKIFTQAWIYPYSLLTSELFELSRLQGSKLPGYIHAWYENLIEIESFVKYKNEFNNGKIDSWYEILDTIDGFVEYQDPST